MGFLLEIAIDYFGWVLGKKSQDAFSKGSKREAYILLSIFLIIIVVMALFSLAWIIGFFNQ